MTKTELGYIERKLRELPPDQLDTFADWLGLLATDRSRALYILNEAERIVAQGKK